MVFVVSLILLFIWALRNQAKAPATRVIEGPSRMAHWVDSSGQRVTPARVEAWIEARGAAIVSPLERNVLRAFQMPGYVDNILYQSRPFQSDPWALLEKHWQWELDMQRCIESGARVAAAREATLPSEVNERVRWVLNHPSIRAAEEFVAAREAHDKVLAEATAAHKDDLVAGPLKFQPHEPQWLADATQQPEAAERLLRLVHALQPPEVLPTRHVLFTGPAGLGKTLYAKILTHELRHYNHANGQPMPDLIEVFGSNVTSVKDYDSIFRKIQQGGQGAVLFIDEIHTLDSRLATKLYGLLTDGLYAFHGELNPVVMPPVFVIAATTDYGMMHSALKRRFGEPVHLKLLAASDLARLARSRPTPIDDDAVTKIVSVAKWSGAPWEVLSLVGEAELVQRAERAPSVTLKHVQQVFTALDLDGYGLRPVDRAVLSALYQSPRYKDGRFVCFALSQADICAQTKLDPGEFAAVIKPRLQGRQLITTRSGYGQVLEKNAYEMYGGLCPTEHRSLIPRV